MYYDPNTGQPINNQQPQQGYYQQPPQGGYVQSQNNTLAIAGFILALVFGGIISLILSIVGLNKAKELNGNGKGFAIAGIVISAIKIVFNIIYLIFVFLAVMSDL